MMLDIYNSSPEIIIIQVCGAERKYYINPGEHKSIGLNNDIIQIEVSHDLKSCFSAFTFKRISFQLLTKYTIENKFDDLSIVIEDQIVEDDTFAKYCRCKSKDESIFSNIELLVVDYDEILAKSKRYDALGYFILFCGHFFSIVNAMFVAIGIAIGEYFGFKYGILIYLLLFTVYFTIIVLINVHDDKDSVPIKDKISNDYLCCLFQTY